MGWFLQGDGGLIPIHSTLDRCRHRRLDLRKPRSIAPDRLILPRREAMNRRMKTIFQVTNSDPDV
jgi:hypothetical protein